MQKAVAAIIVALALSLSGCAATPYSREIHAASVSMLQAHARNATMQIESAQKPVNVVYAGFALSSQSDAFQGDIWAGQIFAKRMAANSVSLLFSNRQTIGKAEFPFATEEDISLGIAETVKLAEQIDKRNGSPPLVVALLTSHGHQEYLSVNADGFSRPMSAHSLAKTLKPLESYPTLLIISACYSGSLIPSLQTDNRLIFTASSADRTSFGCGTSSNRTWFVDSLAQSFDPKLTFVEWHAKTAKLVESWESANKYQASLPQIWIGKNMAKLAATRLGSIAYDLPAALAAYSPAQ